MAQTPKSVSTKKTATNKDKQEPQKKIKATAKSVNPSKQKINKADTAQTVAKVEKKSSSITADIEQTKAVSKLALQADFATPAFLNTQSPLVATYETPSTVNLKKNNDNDDIESMDFDVPITNDRQEDNPINDPQTEFVGFIVPSGCGNVLKAEREAQGLSLSEVCKSLRLSVNQIQAIEEDDFANLPKQSIVRGFIRNYARLLKIDAEPILKAFQNIVPDEAPLSLSVKATADESVIGAKEMKFTPKIIANIAFGLMVLFALAYLYTHYIKPHAKTVDGLALNADEIQKISPDMMPLPLPNPVNQPSKNETTSAVSIQNVGATETSNSDKTNDFQSSMASTFEKKLNTQATIESTQAEATLPALNPLPIANINGAPLPGESQLSFKLNEQSWVRVETPDGKKIFSELLQAGSQTLNAKPPFTIIIGNASATKIAINNIDYDLTPVTRANVARVQIK